MDPDRDLAGVRRCLLRDQEKKLTEAARHWALGGREATDEVIADLEAWGAPAETIDAWRDARTDEPFEVHRACWDTVRLFVTSGTQWRTAGMSGIRTGLDYAGVAIVAQSFGLAIDAARLAALQTMETEAMKAWAETRDE